VVVPADRLDQHSAPATLLGLSTAMLSRRRTFAPPPDIYTPQLTLTLKKSKGGPYSITERRVAELIPVLGSQPAGDVSHKPGGRLPLLSARPAVTPTILKRAATNFAAW